jgi:hypothetical protein
MRHQDGKERKIFLLFKSSFKDDGLCFVCEGGSEEWVQEIT